MIDTFAAHLALRNRALSLVVCTTGSQTLSATATGFARSAGSFVTDGFVVGMELNATGAWVGAGNAGPHVITSVSALALGCAGCAVDAPAAARTLSVGLPALRAFENIAFTPQSGRPYVEEDFIPATMSLLSFPAQGGQVEETMLYVLKIYGLDGSVLPNAGIAAIRKTVEALRLLFAPGTLIAAGSNTVRVRGDVAVQSGQILPQGDGWSVCSVTIPCRAYSTNTIAA